MRQQRLIFVLLILAASLQIMHFYPLMPERMASHFDATGKPNGWIDRNGFVSIYALVVFLLCVIFILTPRLLFLLPDSMINLPNKAYWLAPERRMQTAAAMEQSLGTAGNATTALLICIFQMAFSANLEKDATLSSSAWLLMIAYVVFMTGWMVRFVRSFSRIPRPPDRH
jgi:uncharacterized membrane protein